MKIVSLNLWAGRLLDELKAFLEEHADADVFCFQEVFNSILPEVTNLVGHPDLFALLQAALPDYVGMYAPAVDGRAYVASRAQWLSYGLAIFVRKDVRVLASGDVMVHGTRNWDEPYHPRNMQYVRIETTEGPLWILHVHGLWVPRGKGDTPERLEQSKNICEFVDALPGKVVLLGDFNLAKDTRSRAMIAQRMRDLIAEFAIDTTRTKHYTKQERFADYAFVRDVEIASFEVPEVECSDHRPLIVITGQ